MSTLDVPLLMYNEHVACHASVLVLVMTNEVCREAEI